MRERWPLVLGLLSQMALAQSPLIVTVTVRTCSASSIFTTALPTSSSVQYGSSAIPTLLSSMQPPPTSPSTTSTPIPTPGAYSSLPGGDVSSSSANPPASTSADNIPLPSYVSGDNVTSRDGSIYIYEGDTTLSGTTIYGAGSGLKRRQSADQYRPLIDCLGECDGTPACVAVTLLGQSCLLYGAVESTTAVLGAQAAFNVQRFPGFVDLTPDPYPRPDSTSVENPDEEPTPPPFSTPYMSTDAASSPAQSNPLPVYSSTDDRPSQAQSISMDFSATGVYSPPPLSTDHATSFTPPPPTTSILGTILPVTLSIPSSSAVSSSSQSTSSSVQQISSSVAGDVPSQYTSIPVAEGSSTVPSAVSSRSESPMVSATSLEVLPTTFSLGAQLTTSDLPAPSTEIPVVSQSSYDDTATTREPETSSTIDPKIDEPTTSAPDLPSASTMMISSSLPSPVSSPTPKYSSDGAHGSSATSPAAESLSLSPYPSSSTLQEFSATWISPSSSSAAPSSLPPEYPSSSAALSSVYSSTSSSSSSSIPGTSSSSTSSPLSSTARASVTSTSSLRPTTTTTTTTTSYSPTSSSSSRSSLTSAQTSSSRSFSSSLFSSMSSSSSRTTSSSSSSRLASTSSYSSTRSSSSSSTMPSATPVKNFGKRGLCYTNDTLTKGYSLSGQNSQVSWGYNYYYQNNTSPNSTDFNPALTFVPLLFNDDPNLLRVWPTMAQKAIDEGADSLLGFNEPDLCYPGSACMAVNQSVKAWRSHMEPFAGKARLGAPAVTNGGPPSSLQWLGEFMGNCTGCTIDFVPIHWYSSVYAFSYLQYYVQLAYNVTQKPIWVTEFGIDGSGGSEQQYQAFLQSALPWLDAVPYVERYSYFYNGPGYLIKPDGSGLSAQGQIYNSYTAPCPNWQNSQGKCT